MRFPVGDFQDGVYAIDAAAGSDGFDPVLYLYRRAGNRLVEIASDDDGEEHRKLTHSCASGQHRDLYRWGQGVQRASRPGDTERQPGAVVLVKEQDPVPAGQHVLDCQRGVIEGHAFDDASPIEQGRFDAVEQRLEPLDGYALAKYAFECGRVATRYLTLHVTPAMSTASND